MQQAERNKPCAGESASQGNAYRQFIYLNTHYYSVKTMKNALCVILVLTIELLIISPLQAMDEIKFERGQGDNDVRMAYKLEILKSALDKTIETYGPYKISQNAPKLNTLRAQSALQEGELLNVFYSTHK